MPKSDTRRKFWFPTPCPSVLTNNAPLFFSFRLKPDEWIIVPKPEAKQGEQPVQHRTSAVVAKSARVQHALIWSAAPPIPSLTKNGLLHLRGTNSSENTIRFAAISASFVAGKRQACLFQNDSFKLKPSLIAEGDTKAIANTTSMNSASGTDVNESTDGTTSNEMMTPKGVGMTSDTKGHVDGKGLTGQTTSNVAGTTIETTGSMGDGKAATPQIPSVGANFTQDATSGTSTKPSVNAVPQEQFKVTGTPVAGARAQTSQATTAPFDEASKYDSAGLVELRPSPGSAPRKAVVHKLEAGKGTQKWEVEISAADGGTMAIKPGEWLELQITGDTGIAATQTMFIDEDYKDETSASDGHFGKPLNVIII